MTHKELHLRRARFERTLYTRHMHALCVATGATLALAGTLGLCLAIAAAVLR